jgi:hypothetical protein
MDETGDALTMRIKPWPGFLVCLILPFWLWPSVAQGQWSAAIQIGSDRFWGGSIENTPEHRSFRPYRPTAFSAAIQRRGSGIGLGLRLGYTEAALALEGSDAVVAANGVFTILSLSPEISYRLATVGAGNDLLLQAGPLLELWDIIDQGARTRWGAQAALAFAVPLSRKISAAVSGGVALISSPFEDGELLDGYELRALWRRRLAGGLEYQF